MRVASHNGSKLEPILGKMCESYEMVLPLCYGHPHSVGRDSSIWNHLAIKVKWKLSQSQHPSRLLIFFNSQILISGKDSGWCAKLFIWSWIVVMKKSAEIELQTKRAENNFLYVLNSTKCNERISVPFILPRYILSVCGLFRVSLTSLKRWEAGTFMIGLHFLRITHYFCCW